MIVPPLPPASYSHFSIHSFLKRNCLLTAISPSIPPHRAGAKRLSAEARVVVVGVVVVE
jgi:hypothetical protein